MSELKFSENLFLGKIELDKFKKFIQEEGYERNRLDNSGAFGILKRVSDTDFDNFKVETGGTAGTIKLSVDNYALDSSGRVIYKAAEDNIAIPNDNSWYWVKIAWLVNENEVGTVDIDTSGNMTGTNTLFTEALRGQPNFPSKISFPDSVVNTGEYEITQVIDDTNVVLSGEFTAETTAKYSVVGTFTPGVTPSAPDKYPFQYDDTLPFTASLGLILDFGSYPNKPSITTNQEFIIAVVKNNAGTITIQDRRSEIWKSKASYEASQVNTATNPIIGIEAIQHDNDFSPRDKNIIQFGWGARATNWSDSTTLRQITINELKSNFTDTNGNPVTIQKNGVFETAADFTTNDFDGWRLYYENGNYSIITLSEKDGSGIRLTLDVLNPENYTANDLLTIVPDSEEIEIRIKSNTTDPNVEQINDIHLYNIREGYAKIWVTVPSASAGYDVLIDYRHKTLNQYTDWIAPSADSADGFYDESSFNSSGNLAANPGDRNQTTYTSAAAGALVELNPSIRSYHNVIANVSTGELLGVDDLVLSNANPVVDLTVGQEGRHQLIDGNSITITQDMFINLKILDVDGAAIEDGVRWILQFKEPINSFGAFEIKVVTDYVNPTTFTELKEYTDTINNIVGSIKYLDGYILEFTWDIDNSVWIIKEDKAFIERGGSVNQTASFEYTVDFNDNAEFNDNAIFYNRIIKSMHSSVIAITGTEAIVVASPDGHMLEIEDGTSDTVTTLTYGGTVAHGQSIMIKVDDASNDLIFTHSSSPINTEINTPIGVDVVVPAGAYIELMVNENAGGGGGFFWKIIKSSVPLHGVWITPSFSGNWSAGGDGLRYRLDSSGRLEFIGGAQNSVLSGSFTNDQIFVVGSDYVPSGTGVSHTSVVVPAGGSDVYVSILGTGTGTPGGVWASSVSYTTNDSVNFDSSPPFPLD